MNAKITYRDYEEIVRQNPAMFDPASRRQPARAASLPGLLLAVFMAMTVAGVVLGLLSVYGA
jgi:hypothetical protein